MPTRQLANFVLAVTAAVLVCLAPPRTASGVDDPSLDYKTLTTPNFYVHYESRLKGFAYRVARNAEEAHAILTPLLDHEPTTRTHVIVNDQVDTANGSASTTGRNTIRIFAMPPGPDGVLGFYNDWLRILVFHEYVHILHLDTTNGPVKWINSIVGRLLHPNAILPRWYVEGLAVLYESELTGTGRNNSSLFRMWLRTAALDGTFFGLGTATGSPISWPQGTTPYLYGGFFMKYIEEKYGLSFATDFNHEYGKRLVPFSMNETLREITGRSFEELWDEWSAHMKGQAAATHVAVRAAGETPLEYITDDGGRHRYPRARPGTDQITFFKNGLDSHPQFAVTNVKDEGAETLFELDGAAGSSAWTPDGESLVYGRATVNENVYTYHDLYAWHPDATEPRRLTEGKRARDPTISPGGDKIAYVRVLPGTNDLVVCDFERHEVRNCEIVAGGSRHDSSTTRRWQQIADPTWTPDGRGLVFSWWRLDRKQRDLWVYRPDDEKRLRKLTDDAAQDTAPHFGPEGLLYWSSDRTGIFNIYARRLEDEETWQISNVDTGVFHPRVSQGGRWIYVSAYTSEGYELARFPRPTRLKNEAPKSYPGRAVTSYPTVASDDWSSGEYSAVRWLQPLLLKPNFGVLSTGSGLGATVVGREPLGHHNWALSGAILTNPGFVDYRGNVGLSYSWRGGPLNVRLSGAIQENPRERGFVAESRSIPYVERRYTARLGVGYPIREIGDFLALSTSLLIDRQTFRNRPEVDHEPGDIQPREPEHGWFNQVDLSLNYANLDRYAHSIGVERGIAGYLTLRVQDELLGADAESMSLNYGLRLFHPNPLLERHILHLRLTGGIARSEGGNPAFAIGGTRPQDVLSDIIFQSPRGQFVLRGYPPALLVGDQFQVWTGAYRFPILRIESGPSTVPIYLNRLKGSVFVDTGGAFRGLLADADLRTGVGAEVQLGTQFGYYLHGALRVGFARGLGDDGISEWYVLYGGGF